MPVPENPLPGPWRGADAVRRTPPGDGLSTLGVRRAAAGQVVGPSGRQGKSGPTDPPDAMKHEDSTSSLQDARTSERRDVEAPVRLRIDSSSIQGTSDNLSSAGLLFFTDEPLRVTVEIEEQGELKSYRGRLLRVQRMSESSTGLAVEFDPA